MSRNYVAYGETAGPAQPPSYALEAHSAKVTLPGDSSSSGSSRHPGPLRGTLIGDRTSSSSPLLEESGRQQTSSATLSPGRPVGAMSAYPQHYCVTLPPGPQFITRIRVVAHPVFTPTIVYLSNAHLPADGPRPPPLQRGLVSPVARPREATSDSLSGHRTTQLVFAHPKDFGYQTIQSREAEFPGWVDAVGLRLSVTGCYPSPWNRKHLARILSIEATDSQGGSISLMCEPATPSNAAAIFPQGGDGLDPRTKSYGSPTRGYSAHYSPLVRTDDQRDEACHQGRQLPHDFGSPGRGPAPLPPVVPDPATLEALGNSRDYSVKLQGAQLLLRGIAQASHYWRETPCTSIADQSALEALVRDVLAILHAQVGRDRRAGFAALYIQSLAELVQLTRQAPPYLTALALVWEEALPHLTRRYLHDISEPYVVTYRSILGDLLMTYLDIGRSSLLRVLLEIVNPEGLCRQTAQIYLDLLTDLVTRLTRETRRVGKVKSLLPTSIRQQLHRALGEFARHRDAEVRRQSVGALVALGAALGWGELEEYLVESNPHFLESLLRAYLGSVGRV
ncbi:hypothetical protein IWQ60_005413 [Tieghemiomyces parasiticus]|uniref:Uncharacterized protein n=1 Tax=Tieghemiomyces parasiticus TaxID=78921 RepID=A0A9W8A974_9FUNG|nr:hypothetical protein IWQ60_005413 [Tieghemiomyces parasiticus]